MGPETLTAIETAIRKQETAEAVRILQIWRNEAGWRGDWMDVRKPKRPAFDSGAGTCRQIAFLVQDLLEISGSACMEILHVAPGPAGGVRVWYRAREGSPTLYARTPDPGAPAGPQAAGVPV